MTEPSATVGSPSASASTPKKVSLLEGAHQTAIGVWHEGNVKLGAVAEYSLPVAVDVPMQEWPTVRFLVGDDMPHEITPRYAVTGVRAVTVLYSFTSKSVVSIEPSQYDQVTAADYTGIPTNVPEAGEQASDQPTGGTDVAPDQATGQTAEQGAGE